MKSIYYQFHSKTQNNTQRKKPRSYYWPSFAGILFSLCLSGPGFSHVGSVLLGVIIVASKPVLKKHTIAYIKLKLLEFSFAVSSFRMRVKTLKM